MTDALDKARPQFTMVFDGDLREFKGNPLKAVADWGPVQSAGVGNAFSEPDAAKQRIAELEGILSDPSAVRGNIMRGSIKTPDDLVWLYDTNGPVAAVKAEAYRTGFLAAQKQAVKLAKWKAFDTTTDANWDTPQSACDAIAQAIAQLKPEGEP
jgi:hypothetical protein